MKRVLSLSPVFAALLAAGCGGGPSFTPSPYVPTAPGESREFPSSYSQAQHLVYSGGSAGSGLRPGDARHMPVWTTRDALIVGIHPDAAVSLPDTGFRGDTDLHYGTTDDGTNRDHLAAFVSDLVEEKGGSVSRFPSPPVVRLVGPATNAERDGAIRAVQLLNAALPDNWKLDVEFSPDRRRPTPSMGPDVPGEIILAFYPDNEWRHGEALGYADTAGLGAGNVGIRRNRDGDHVFTGAILHEIIHLIANVYHVEDFRSIMNVMSFRGFSTIDREFLHVLFTRFDHGDNPADFGPWDDTATYIHGSNGHASFGVAMRGTPGNRYFEPWGSGWNPNHYQGGASSPAQNSDLSGTVTWNGTLVGFTPDENPVVGDAELRVRMSNLSGRADFTGLEQWAAGTAPGSAGSGTMWGDGDLSYRLDITGNRFRDQAGSLDAGRLTGAFVGYNHEGVTGTLERGDLTAAFGATR